MKSSANVKCVVPKRASVVKEKKVKVTVSKADSLGGCFDVLLTIWRLFELVPKELEEKGSKAEQSYKERTVKTWLKVSGEVHWVKFMKYKLAAWFSAHLEQDPPPRPKGLSEADKALTLLGGACGRMARLHMRKYPVVGSRRTDETALTGMEFLNTVLNSKKGMPRLGPEDLKAAELATVEELTTTRPDKEAIELKPNEAWGDMKDNSVMTKVNLMNLIIQIKRTVREIFKEEDRMGDADRVIKSLPSGSANYNNTRANGGGVGALFDSGVLEGLRRPGGFLQVEAAPKRYTRISLTERQLEEEWQESEGRVPSVYVEEQDGNEWATYGGQLRSRSPNEGVVEETGDEEDLKVFVIDDKALLEQTVELTKRVTNYALTEKPYAKPVGLAEPLKIRVITAGPPLTYFAMRAIWFKMHSIMRRLNLFKLIGQPDDAELLMEILGRPNGNRNVFVSGDYRGATNELDPAASVAAAEEISIVLGLNEDERTLFKRSLTEHIFMTSGQEEEQRQLWGQLMGSITSFPILCIVNAAVMRWSMEINEDRDIPIKSLCAAINGDDVVAKTIAGIEKIYEQVALAAGLHLSVGKTFYHTQFFNINSRSYVVLDEPRTIMSEFPDW